MKTHTLDQMASAIRESGLLPWFEPDESRLLIHLWRTLARGHALSDEQVNDIASSLEIAPDVVVSVLCKTGERDDEGHIVGLLGLSLEVSSRRFQVNGQTLYTWCAWDTLFLPAMLGQTATVEAACEATEEKIRLTVAPERVEHADPSSAVISMVAASPTGSGLESAADVQAAFCYYVRFFRSAEMAAEWLSGKTHNGHILSVEEGHLLGRMVFAELLGYA